MPWLIAIIGTAIGSFVLKFMLALGIGFGTYFVVLPNLLQFINTKISALPPVASQTLGMLQFDVCVTIIVSAYVAKTLGGLFIDKITP